MLLRHSWALGLWALAMGGSAAGDDGPTRDNLRTHSLVSPYLDSDMQSRWWDFGGHTIVRADSYIRLTSDRPSQAGFLFSRVPLTATNWEIDVDFKIHGTGNLHGDGFAMWLTKSRNWQGPVFGAVDKFEGLGIFVDTYRNNRPGVNFPYVMAMLGDGQTPYDQEHDGLANEVAGCSARGLRNSAHPTRMRLTYFAEGNLTVSLVYKTDSPEDWTECFSTSEITIPSVSYLGFTAETGELSDNHDILKVDTKNLYTVAAKDLPSSGDNTVRGSGKGRSSYDGGYGGKKKSGGWGWFFIKFVLLIVICGGAYVGFTIWRTQQRGRSSRF